MVEPSFKENNPNYNKHHDHNSMYGYSGNNWFANLIHPEKLKANCSKYCNIPDLNNPKINNCYNKQMVEV